MNPTQRKSTSLFLGTFLVTVWLVLQFALPPQVHAQVTQAWKGVCVGGPDKDVATIQGLQCVIANILSIAISGIGLAGFVMLIIGSFRYLLSGGNAKGTEEGKNTMTFAVAGLVVALSAFIILNLIAGFTGVNAILNFQIPGSSTQF